MSLWFRFLDWLQRRFGIGKRAVIPREPVSLRPIGVVRNNIATPRPDGWDTVRSDVIIRDELAEALDGIDAYSHIIVVFAFDKVPEAEQKLRLQARSDPHIPEQGVLATRSQLRPNPVGVSVVRLLRRRGTILRVEGLDAIDGTPILDIKPYYANYDAVPDAAIPDWARALPDD